MVNPGASEIDSEALKSEPIYVRFLRGFLLSFRDLGQAVGNEDLARQGGNRNCEDRDRTGFRAGSPSRHGLDEPQGTEAGSQGARTSGELASHHSLCPGRGGWLTPRRGWRGKETWIRQTIESALQAGWCMLSIGIGPSEVSEPMPQTGGDGLPWKHSC